MFYRSLSRIESITVENDLDNLTSTSVTYTYSTMAFKNKSEIQDFTILLKRQADSGIQFYVSNYSFRNIVFFRMR